MLWGGAQLFLTNPRNVMCWVTYARSKSFLSFSTPICQCLINNSYVSAQWYTIGRRQTKKIVERGDNTYYSLYFFQDFSEKSPKQKKRARWHIFFIQSLDSSWKYLCKNMFFVVPVTFSDMFILNINVFFGIYSFDLIRILLNKLRKYMLFHYFLFLFISLVWVVFVLEKTVLRFLLIC